MRLKIWLRTIAAAGLCTATALPALAQDYDPVAPVTNGVCGLINFQFCPQPPGPAAPLPDPEGDAERAARPLPPPSAEPVAYAPVHHRRHHRHHKAERAKFIRARLPRLARTPVI